MFFYIYLNIDEKGINQIIGFWFIFALTFFFKGQSDMTWFWRNKMFFFPGKVFANCVEEGCHVFFWILELSQRSARGRRWTLVTTPASHLMTLSYLLFNEQTAKSALVPILFSSSTCNSELQFLVRHILSQSKKFFKSKALGAFPCRPPVAEGGIVLAQCHPITATSSHPLKILGAD